MALPLAPYHIRRLARMTDFHGYQLPLSFTTILEESKGVRESAGLFDISHMGHFLVSGPGALRAVNHLITSDLEAVPFGKSLYGLMPNDDGGTVDDLILSASSENEVHIIVNAGNREGDFAWIRSHLPGNIDLVDLSPGQIALALQGPTSSKIVACLKQGLETMVRREVRFSVCQEEKTWVSRTGYTGEDGWEFFGPESLIFDFYQILCDQGPEAGMIHAGLGARDLLRLEMGYPLYGQELGPDRTAFDARLDFAVNLRKTPFIGREKLLEKREDRSRERLVGFVLKERGIPRSHCSVIDPESSRRVGEVTSGGFSPRVGGGFGLAYMEPSFIEEFVAGKDAGIEIHGKIHRGMVHSKPFIKSGLVH